MPVLISCLIALLFCLAPLYAESPMTPATASPLGSPRPGYNPAAFNPAMGLVLDAAASNTTLNRGDLAFRSAEMNFMASVDPYANLYAVINGTKDDVEVEEAAFVTTSLPANLTVRGGRFFANFGRLPHWHDHELPFVNRTASLQNFIGGEARSDGIELMHLFRTPFFLQGTLGAYNVMGSDNHRLEESTVPGSPGHTNGRPWSSFTYLGRLFSYVPIGDDDGLDLGASEALTPRQYYIEGVRVDHEHSARSLTGIDITFRHEPLSQNVARKLIWSTEVFQNNELRPDTIEGTTTTEYRRKTAWGGFSYVDWRFASRWSGGGFGDLAEGIDHPERVTRTFGVTLNFLPSEFQRIRLQLSQVRANDGSPTDDQIFLQWFGTIGTHVHVFKDR
jgi:hypothetical protein